MTDLPREWRSTLLAIMGLGVLLLLSACNEGEGQEATAAAPAQNVVQEAWLRATPTLVPRLATAAAGGAMPTLTPTAGPSATPTASPTATPLPAEQIDVGRNLMDEGNYDEAARAFQSALSAPGALDRSQQADALWGLSRAYLGDERHAEALDVLERFTALVQPAAAAVPDSQAPNLAPPEPEADARIAQAQFEMAEAQGALGECAAAIPAYESYLQANPDLAAYVETRIAACRQQLGDVDAAIIAYESALSAPAPRLAEVDTRLQLAELQLTRENFVAAVAQYDAVRDLALTENTKGEMTYLAGMALMQAGNVEEAHQRFLQGVADYPGAFHSYLGLVELVDDGVDVDPYQRGLVDFNAQAYEPAIGAFDAYIQANPDTYRADARQYLAWSYEGLGNLEAALAQLDAYAQLDSSEEEAAPHAAAAALERGKMLARAGQSENAIATYQALISDFPDSEEARVAAWQSGLLAEQLGDAQQARRAYEALAERYPDHELAPQALFNAAMLAWQGGDSTAAHDLWTRLMSDYPGSESSAAALIWLLRSAPEDEAEAYVITATNLSAAGYYHLRARELAAGEQPFHAPATLELQPPGDEERAEAEAWLAGLVPDEDVDVSGELSGELAQDARLVRGQKLWELGLYAEAKRELEEVRQSYSHDVLATYQLALYFRDLGLYRSSILAADALLLLSGQNVFEAPRFIARLSYPVYYQDLIRELADEYGYDPLLQFALVRQESLFESFIASHVGAQGLSQVMPATGEDIARSLGWPDFSKEDLYLPYVGLAFGAYYLDRQLETFDGDVYAALSAYNAGPGNAARWVAAAPHDPDLYLETVDYPETRTYIERIYVGYTAYRWLYGRQ